MDLSRGPLLERRASFSADELSVARARRFVRDALEYAVSEEVRDDVVLAVSELTTNVLAHAGTPFDVVVVVDTCVRVEVADGHPQLPTPRLVVSGSADGRGLHIVSSVARAWGAIPEGGGKRVWAEFDL